jgi:hypothetical protein
MKRLSGILSAWLLVWLLAAALAAVPGAWAKPTTPEQAQTAVLNWLGLDAVPLGAPLGRKLKNVQTFKYGDNAAYYVVCLDPAGLVFLPADDLVEPIIGFLPGGVYDPSLTNPLGALVSQDIPARVLEAQAVEAKGLEALAPESPQAAAQRKWDLLLKPTGPTASELAPHQTSISDVRVAPLVQSQWNQAGADGSLPDPNCNYPCYNYFTPPNAAGNAANYVCGCVATAMAQLMRYWQHPTADIGIHYYTYHLSNVPKNDRPTRGGDDHGGAYVWGDMPLTTSSATTATQRAAIGRLTSDAGLAINMWYDTVAAGGSGANVDDTAGAFINTFGYSNARYYYTGSNIPDSNRNLMVNPNLHAQCPVLFGIYGKPGGHAIICDGYGYNSSTIYHHLNLGWSGYDDAWYNLPTIDTSDGTFTSVDTCVYNVYPSGSGEIIAGRVTQADGVTPLSGATVSAGGYSATTDAKGIYALAKVTSNTTFTVTASKTGYASSSQAVTTGKTQNGNVNSGNKWPIDFALSASVPPVITLSQALDNTRLSFNTSGSANWYGQSTTWYYGGSAAQSGAITASQSSALQTTVVGPGTLTFSWKVSSELNHDYLNLFLDATLTDRVSGSAGWTQKTLNVPAGIHTVLWQYAKDSSGSQGSDCGWVDKVVYTRKGGIAPVLPLLLN